MPDEVTDALEAQRVGFRERPRDEHVRVLEGEGHGVLTSKIHVGLVEHHDAFGLRAERVQLRRAEAASAWRVRGGDERERGFEVPTQFRQRGKRGQGEIRIERDRVGQRTGDFREHGVERVAGTEELNRRATRCQLGTWLHKRPRRQREQFIRTVADDDVLRRAAVELGEFFAQRGGGGVWVKPEPSVHRRLYCSEDFGRGRVGILVGVELDEAGDLRLLAGNVGVQPLNQRANE